MKLFIWRAGLSHANSDDPVLSLSVSQPALFPPNHSRPSRRAADKGGREGKKMRRDKKKERRQKERLHKREGGREGGNGANL